MCGGPQAGDWLCTSRRPASSASLARDVGHRAIQETDDRRCQPTYLDRLVDQVERQSRDQEAVIRRSGPRRPVTHSATSISAETRVRELALNPTVS